MQEDPKKEAEKAYAEIMYMFRYTYKDAWAPDNIFDGKSRLWVKSFNNLVEKGYIKRRKKYPGYEYKWVAALPENY
ncbi:MAG: hypothetical protein U9O94_02775 [Nanoarchaeota archaeon]|nr:hypothetical protein [Nanoarchaeota archaeon]